MKLTPSPGSSRRIGETGLGRKLMKSGWEEEGNLTPYAVLERAGDLRLSWYFGFRGAKVILGE